jgi:hypothetical protein
MADQATPAHLALLQAIAQQAARWWRQQLADPGYLGKFNNGDTSRNGELTQIMASMVALSSPGPDTSALDQFEQLLTAALWQRLERNPSPKKQEDIVLGTDYAPEGLLREIGAAAQVSGFPWKTTMWVCWAAEAAECYVEVRHGYGAPARRLPTPEVPAAC